MPYVAFRFAPGETAYDVMLRELLVLAVGKNEHGIFYLVRFGNQDFKIANEDIFTYQEVKDELKAILAEKRLVYLERLERLS